MNLIRVRINSFDMAEITLNFKEREEKLNFNITVVNKVSGVARDVYEICSIGDDEELFLTYYISGGVYFKQSFSWEDFNGALNQLIFNVAKYYIQKNIRT
jgi:hypothetical protein